MEDIKILKAGAIGIFSTILSEVASIVLLYLGIGKYSVYQLNSLIVTINRPSEIMGLIVNFIVGSCVSVFIYLLLKKKGHGLIVLKCVMAGLITWILWEFIFTLTIEGKTIPIRPINDYYNHLFGTFVFGVSVGLLQNRYIFKKYFLHSSI